MMKICRHIITFMLIILLLASGLQRLSSEDINIDGRIDVSDAVFAAKRFVEVSQDAEVFKQSFGKMISAMYIAAGLKTVIQANDKPLTSSSSDIVFLLALFVFVFSFCIFSEICDIDLSYSTLSIEPPLPVP
jgi:hypothetical protein